MNENRMKPSGPRFVPVKCRNAYSVDDLSYPYPVARITECSRAEVLRMCSELNAGVPISQVKRDPVPRRPLPR